MDNFQLYRLGQFLALSVPLKISYAIAILISDIRYIFAKEDRRRVFENLKTIFPHKPDRQLRGIRLRMFRNFAKYLVDFFRFSVIDEKYLKRYVRMENMKYYDEALKNEKGAVGITAHIGNWELAGLVMGAMGYPLVAVAMPHADKRVNDFFNSQRESKGVRVVALGHAVRPCLKALKENKVIALVGDRDFTEKGVVLDFFGKPTIFPEGPAAFSLATGAPIVAGFIIRNKNDTFTMKVERPIEYKSTGDKEKDTKGLMKKYIAIYEDYIRKYPDQWFMFRRFWTE